MAVGFDPRTRSWVTDAHASQQPPDKLPKLDGLLLFDNASCDATSADWGRNFKPMPIAVLKPGSVLDVAKMVQYTNKHALKVAMRGQGHCAAFDAALVRECKAITREVEAMLQHSSDPFEIWRVHDYLSEKRREIDRKYDYRYSVLITVFSRLLYEGWVRLELRKLPLWSMRWSPGRTSDQDACIPPDIGPVSSYSGRNLRCNVGGVLRTATCSISRLRSKAKSLNSRAQLSWL